ncbi:tape measure protein [Rhodococcus hoagii]|nr:tape measure protein [Prescottella equi]
MPHGRPTGWADIPQRPAVDDGYFKRIRSEIQGNPIEQNVDVKINERRLAKAKSDLESMVKAEEAARRKAADAAGAQTVAEAKLQALREKGVTDVGRLAAAEEAVEKAKRSSEAASKSLAEAESKRKAGDMRVQRIEAQFDGSKADAQSESFLQRLAAKSETSGHGIGSKLVGGIGAAMKTGAIAVGATVATVLGAALTKGFNRLTAIENAQAKLKGLGLAADEIKSVMGDVSASVSGTAFGTNEAADAAAMALSNGIKPGKDLQRTLKLVGDAAAFANKGFGEVAPMVMKVAESGKLGGDVLTQMGENAIPIMAGLQKVTGKTAEEVRKMASDGKIDFETFQKALESSIGGSALAAGDTFQGSMKNMGAALGRLGETLLSAPFKAAPGVFKGITGGIDNINAKTKGVLELLTTGAFGEAWEKAFPGKDLSNSGLARGIVTISENIHSLFAATKLFATGDFTTDIGRALGVSEDSELVDRILRTREAIEQARDTVKLFFGVIAGDGADVDLPWMNKVIDAGVMVRGWGEQIGRIFGTVKDILVELGPPVGQIVGSLGQASAAIGIQHLVAVPRRPRGAAARDRRHPRPGGADARRPDGRAPGDRHSRGRRLHRLPRCCGGGDGRREGAGRVGQAVDDHDEGARNRHEGLDHRDARVGHRSDRRVDGIEGRRRRRPRTERGDQGEPDHGDRFGDHPARRRAGVVLHPNRDRQADLGDGVVGHQGCNGRRVGLHPADLRGNRCDLHVAVREHRAAGIHRAQDRAGGRHHGVPAVLGGRQALPRDGRGDPDLAVGDRRPARLGTDEGRAAGPRSVLRVGVELADQARVGRPRRRYLVGVAERDPACLERAQGRATGSRRVLRVGVELADQARLGRPRGRNQVGLENVIRPAWTASRPRCRLSATSSSGSGTTQSSPRGTASERVSRGSGRT